MRAVSDVHHPSHQQKEATESHFPKNNTKFFDMHEIREFRFEGTMTVEVRNWSGSWMKVEVVYCLMKLEKVKSTF